MPTSPTQPVLLIADDHPILVEGIRAITARSFPGVQITSCAPADVLRNSGKKAWDAVILGNPCQHIDLTDLVKSLRAHGFSAPVLVFSSRDDRTLALRLLNCGAAGFLTKDVSPESFTSCLRKLLRGESVVTPELRAAMKAAGRKTDRAGVDGLTDREMAIFQLIGSGTGTREIADRLGISVRTVEKHRENIKLKLGLHNAAQLATAATSWVVEH